jgi:hypothetical protein
MDITVSSPLAFKSGHSRSVPEVRHSLVMATSTSEPAFSAQGPPTRHEPTGMAIFKR